jgi:hypothetical protein
MKISPMEFFKQFKGKFYLTRPFYIEVDELIKLSRSECIYADF